MAKARRRGHVDRRGGDGDVGIGGRPPAAGACPPDYRSIRIGGADRIATAVAISQTGFPASGSAWSAVIARADTFADALAGGAMAILRRGPLLLNPRDTLDVRVRDELERAVEPAATVYVLGGEDALSPAVADGIAALGFNVRRIDGADRYATAVAIAHEFGDPTTVFLATGRNFPDGLVAGAIAGQSFGVVLLTDDEVLPPSTRDYLPHAKTVYAFGDQAANAYPSAIAVRGVDRYATALNAAKTFFATLDGPGQIGVATGMNFPDALAGGALVTQPGGGPLLLTPPDQFGKEEPGYVGNPEVDYVGDHAGAIKSAYVYGQEDVVSAHAKQQLDDVFVVSCGP